MRMALALVTSVLTIIPAAADQPTPGKLAGHAIVPAETFFNPPADAPPTSPSRASSPTRTVNGSTPSAP